MQYKINIFELLYKVESTFNIPYTKIIEMIKFMVNQDLFQLKGIDLYCESLKKYTGYSEASKRRKTGYAKLLTDERWLEKCIKIKNRDNNRCMKCDDENGLNVHHIKYESYNPWGTRDKFLITLCKDCHKKEHKNGKI